MRLRWGVMVMVAALAACGADGEPVTPTRDATITLSNNGVSAGLRLGAHQGPFFVSLGVGL